MTGSMCWVDNEDDWICSHLRDHNRCHQTPYRYGNPMKTSAPIVASPRNRSMIRKCIQAQKILYIVHHIAGKFNHAKAPTPSPLITI